MRTAAIVERGRVGIGERGVDLIRQYARRPRGLLGVARFREAQRSAYLARGGPVRNLPLCCQELRFAHSIPSSGQSPIHPRKLTPAALTPLPGQKKNKSVHGSPRVKHLVVGLPGTLRRFQSSHPALQTNRRTKRKQDPPQTISRCRQFLACVFDCLRPSCVPNA